MTAKEEPEICVTINPHYILLVIIIFLHVSNILNAWLKMVNGSWICEGSVSKHYETLGKWSEQLEYSNKKYCLGLFNNSKFISLLYIFDNLSLSFSLSLVLVCMFMSYGITWKLEDNLACWFLPSTLIDLGSLVPSCVYHAPGYLAHGLSRNSPSYDSPSSMEPLIIK